MHRAESTLELWVLGWCFLRVALWRLVFGGASWIFDEFLIPCLNTKNKFENSVQNMSEDIKRWAYLEDRSMYGRSNIKVEPHIIRCNVVDWIQQAQDRF
jgi:hypothetical protein